MGECSKLSRMVSSIDLLSVRKTCEILAGEREGSEICRVYARSGMIEREKLAFAWQIVKDNAAAAFFVIWAIEANRAIVERPLGGGGLVPRGLKVR